MERRSRRDIRIADVVLASLGTVIPTISTADVDSHALVVVLPEEHHVHAEITVAGEGGIVPLVGEGPILVGEGPNKIVLVEIGLPIDIKLDVCREDKHCKS